MYRTDVVRAKPLNFSPPIIFVSEQALDCFLQKEASSLLKRRATYKSGEETHSQSDL